MRGALFSRTLRTRGGARAWGGPGGRGFHVRPHSVQCKARKRKPTTKQSPRRGGVGDPPQECVEVVPCTAGGGRHETRGRAQNEGTFSSPD